MKEAVNRGGGWIKVVAGFSANDYRVVVQKRVGNCISLFTKVIVRDESVVSYPSLFRFLFSCARFLICFAGSRVECVKGVLAFPPFIFTADFFVAIVE